MKAIKSVSALLIASVLAIGLNSCKSEDDSTGGSSSVTTPTVTLPESVGTNPFSGKTFTLEGSSSEKMRTWTFTNDAATETYTREKDNETRKSIYRYSYDANKNLLFLSFKSRSGEKRGVKYSYSSLAEYEEVLRKNSSYSEVALETELAVCANQYATMEVYKYVISDSSISFTDYFYGTLPTTVNFATSDGKILMKKGEGILLWRDSGTGNDEEYHCSAPNFKDGKFSGKLSLGKEDSLEIVGTVEGTYTTSGEGTSGCSITLTFTKLPESVTGITTGTEYVLTN